MRRTKTAILAGVSTIGLVTAVCSLFDVFFRLQMGLLWVVPSSWPDWVFVGSLHVSACLITGVPGVLVAVWVMCRPPYPRGHCQTCGYDLTGNVSGRCSECGKPV